MEKLFDLGKVLLSAEVQKRMDDDQFNPFFWACFQRYVDMDWGDEEAASSIIANSIAVNEGEGLIEGLYYLEVDLGIDWDDSLRFTTDLDRGVTMVRFSTED